MHVTVVPSDAGGGDHVPLVCLSIGRVDLESGPDESASFRDGLK